MKPSERLYKQLQLQGTVSRAAVASLHPPPLSNYPALTGVSVPVLQRGADYKLSYSA